MSLRDVFLVALGWCCLVGYGVEWIAGRGKSAIDYARHSLQALPSNRTLAYDDAKHAIWSGWWVPSNGYRLSNGADPDVLFVAGAARDCSIDLAAFPLTARTQQSQVVYAALNGGPFNGPVAVTSDAKVRLAGVGDLIDGVNRLTLRLPDAAKASVTDERVQAIAVRSIAVVCKGH